jgi:hypothetical protein
MLEKIKALLNKAKEILNKVWLFLKKWGLQLINLFILILACIALDWDTFIGGFVSFWTFLLLVYYIFWEAFNAKDIVKKNKE